jgi:hypothetical protein
MKRGNNPENGGCVKLVRGVHSAFTTQLYHRSLRLRRRTGCCRRNLRGGPLEQAVPFHRKAVLSDVFASSPMAIAAGPSRLRQATLQLPQPTLQLPRVTSQSPRPRNIHSVKFGVGRRRD